ncbi:hypothetical protein [Mycolicibacterium cosmeticum]|nr:hypothetical protein [Mycolicibacterium cosmeticum]
MGRIKRRWSEIEAALGFNRWTLVVLGLMFVAGVVLCVSLWLTDVGIGFSEPYFITRYNGQWLRDHAYVPNILAGFTGFLVGVPVALVVLQSIIGRREDNVELAKAKRVSAAAWTEFRSAALEYASSTRRNALLNEAPTDVYPLYEEIFNRLKAYRGDKPFAPQTQEEYDALIAFLKDKEPKFRNAIDSVTRKVGNIDELLKLWSRVLSTWSVVNVYVRSRRLEFGLPWFSDDENSLLVSTLSTSESPLSDFSHVHNGFGHRPPVSMDMTHTWLRSYLAWDKDKVDRTLQSDDQAFGHKGVSEYRERAQEAGSFLNRLQSAIKKIDEQGWPDSSPND